MADGLSQVRAVIQVAQKCGGCALALVGIETHAHCMLELLEQQRRRPCPHDHLAIAEIVRVGNPSASSGERHRGALGIVRGGECA